MKIQSLTAHALQYPEPHDHGKMRCVTLARVETSDGVVGWGESISQFPEAAKATRTIVEEGFAPLLLGEDPRDVERLWQTMLARVWWYGPQGIAAFAISAVDMALWDLKGKLLGAPVCDLLSERLRDKVLVMASIHLDMEDLDWTVREFSWFRDQGYRIVKGGWGKRPEAVYGLDGERDLHLTRTVREVIGDDIDLVLDVLGARVRWDVATATHRLRGLEPCRLRWIEEPLPPHDLASHAQLRAAVSVPIGTGEQEWDVEGYRRLIDSGGVDVVQMDPGRCHGITGCRKVIPLIEAANLQFTAHTWSSALNTAASVHLLASSKAGLTMDFKPHESPMQHELVSDPWVQRDGCLSVRSQPGLGVTVREDIVRKYSFN
ncbi:MAG TPA: mandelate racemase/muconate lactonizing enzyme family protein [Tepidisphaeraceae bacterium]|nr:mandelate racemase/muconate lactonizing enzyme family protein [Tepidisphaeraceae bacterium]